MGLAVGKDKIYVSCSGPYVLYMDLCYRDMSKEGASGILQLQVVGRDHPVSSFPLHASRDDCRRLHRIVYLKAKEEASLHWYSTDSNFKIKNVTVGLSYLLGSRCDSWCGSFSEERDMKIRADWRGAQHSRSSATVRTDTLSGTHTDGRTCVNAPRKLCFCSLTVSKKSQQLVHSPGQEQIIWCCWGPFTTIIL